MRLLYSFLEGIDILDVLTYFVIGVRFWGVFFKCVLGKLVLSYLIVD